MASRERLKEMDWYWGPISNEEVQDLFRTLSDGAYLVRDSASSPDYVLVLRKGGANRSIKIHHNLDGKYGFVKPYTFDSVVELVQFYQHTSLGKYNKDLDIKLLYPVVKKNSVQVKLDQTDWYWGAITRQEVEELLCDQNDGTFLVRDAASSEDYVLTIRKGGTNKLIKIYQRHGKYGFAEPYIFDSVGELVQFYQHTSLVEYNSGLDIKLLYPVRKVAAPALPTSDDVVVLFSRLHSVNGEYINTANKYESMYEVHSKIDQQLKSGQQALVVFKQTIVFYEGQLDLHRAGHGQVQMNEMHMLSRNYELLRGRVKDIKDSQRELETTIKEKSSVHLTLIDDLNHLRPIVKRLYKQREQTKKILKQQGVPDETLGDFLGEKRSMSNWFTHVEGSQEAGNLLKNRPDGTFLIRPSYKYKDFKFVLSIVIKGVVCHCKIIQNEIGYFGFTKSTCDKESLSSLVSYYQRENLKESGPCLGVKLLYPVLDDTRPSADR